MTAHMGGLSRSGRAVPSAGHAGFCGSADDQNGHMTNNVPAPKTVTASLDMTEGSLATEVQVRHHRFAADEAPPAYNSTDEHPDPYDYILAGVAACTVISIRLSAEAKGYPLERADVAVTFERRPPAVEGGQANHITRTITLHGDLSDSEREKLGGAANCAAYNSIINGIPITTETAIPATDHIEAIGAAQSSAHRKG